MNWSNIFKLRIHVTTYLSIRYHVKFTIKHTWLVQLINQLYEHMFISYCVCPKHFYFLEIKWQTKHTELCSYWAYVLGKGCEHRYQISKEREEQDNFRAW